MAKRRMKSAADIEAQVNRIRSMARNANGGILPQVGRGRTTNNENSIRLANRVQRADQIRTAYIENMRKAGTAWGRELDEFDRIQREQGGLAAYRWGEKQSDTAYNQKVSQSAYRKGKAAGGAG